MPSMQELFRRDTPVVAERVVHLDLKGMPPTPQRMLALLDLFAACRFTAVLFEWEDTFPWTVDEAFRCETAYTPQEVVGFYERTVALGMKPIPLGQCLGHAETALTPARYAPLR